MNKEAYVKLAEAYLEDVDLALKTAAVHGYMGLDYTEEKLASFKWLLLNLDADEVAELDKTAEAELDNMEKTAFLGAVLRGGAGIAGKLLGAGGKALGSIGGKATQYAASAGQPTKKFTEFLTKRRGADFAQQAGQEVASAGGIRGWVQQRRMAERFMRGTPGTGVAAGLKSPGAAPAAAVNVPLGAGSRGAQAVESYRKIYGPEGSAARKALQEGGGKAAPKGKPELVPAGANGGGWGEVRKQLKSGLLWGAGFGAASRVLSPAEQPEYQFVGRN